MLGAGALTERLTIQTATPVAVSITSITRSGTTATVTTAAAHGYQDGDYVTIAGAGQAGYNLSEVPIDVTGTTTFTYTVDSGTVTPATGTMTVLFVQDAQGGQRLTWATHATVWGQQVPLSANELLAAQAVNSTQTYRLRIYYLATVTPKMRVSWTPYGFSAAKTLEIHGVLPDKDEPRRFMVLDVGEVVGVTL
jgi:SPP1 family predicted phage head-tail adaptor